MKRISTSLFCLLILAGFLTNSLLADPVQDAAGRMKERLVQIDQLKASGEIGETASGYLAARTGLEASQAALLEAENADRRLIYSSIAQRTGQSVEEVGIQRAVRIAGQARSGVWLQKPDGQWIQKP
jgi:uncharacterized protein YdbL (DUF1318 family)